MIDFILHKKIKNIIKRECKAIDYDFENINIIVDSDDFKLDIENSDFLFLISETIDIPTTARVTIESSDNFLFFSKIEYENDRKAELEKFQNYLKIKTINYGTSFIPYKIKLLKVTPFNN